jgi:protein-S-isoprenylcysteine O-methyltransferase Ste14
LTRSERALWWTSVGAGLTAIALVLSIWQMYTMEARLQQLEGVCAGAKP